MRENQVTFKIKQFHKCLISSGGDTNHLKWLTREHFRTLEKRKPIKTYYFQKLVTKYSDYQEVIDGKLFFSMKESLGNFQWQLTTKSLEVSHKLIYKFKFRIAILITFLESSVRLSAAKTETSNFKTASKIVTYINIPYLFR